MDIEELPSEALRELYTCVSLPIQAGRTREELRASNAGFHLDVPRRRPSEGETVLALEDAPERVAGRVIVLSFGR